MSGNDSILINNNYYLHYYLLTYRFDIDEAIPRAENINSKSTDNKENVQIEKEFSSSNSIKQKSSEAAYVCSSKIVEKTVPFVKPSNSNLRIGPKNDLPRTTSAYDVQNRVRQVNVEMFTVTLKPKKK